MKILKSKRGEILFQSAFILLISLSVIAIGIHVFPCFTAKQQLDTYANELCRTAEISGRVGKETSERQEELTSNTGLSPKVTWSKKGEIQINDKVSVTCTVTKNIGLWGDLGSFPVHLRSTSSGRSEVYWK
jgi:hypothetical protein